MELAYAGGYVMVDSGMDQQVHNFFWTRRGRALRCDSAWHMEGVRNVKGKDAPWIQEDETTLIAQLSWLNGLYKTEKNLFIIASHDDEQRLELIKRGIVGNKLE